MCWGGNGVPLPVPEYQGTQEVCVKCFFLSAAEGQRVTGGKGDKEEERG